LGLQWQGNTSTLKLAEGKNGTFVNTTIYKQAMSNPKIVLKRRLCGLANGRSSSVL